MAMYGIRIESKHGIKVAKADGLTENMMIMFIGKVLPQYASDYYEISIKRWRKQMNQTAIIITIVICITLLGLALISKWKK